MCVIKGSSRMLRATEFRGRGQASLLAVVWGQAGGSWSQGGATKAQSTVANTEKAKPPSLCGDKQRRECVGDTRTVLPFMVAYL